MMPFMIKAKINMVRPLKHVNTLHVMEKFLKVDQTNATDSVIHSKEEADRTTMKATTEAASTMEGVALIMEEVEA